MQAANKWRLCLPAEGPEGSRFPEGPPQQALGIGMAGIKKTGQGCIILLEEMWSHALQSRIVSKSPGRAQFILQAH